jgi:hypothetical protein
MRLPIGTINTLMQGTDIQLCDTCGRYLWLEETPVAPEPEPVAPAKPAAKAKRRKKVAHAPLEVTTSVARPVWLVPARAR